MAGPLPETKANAVIEQVNALVTSAAGYLSPDDLRIRRLIRDAEDAMRADPPVGHSALACVYQAVGDVERTKHHAEISTRLSSNPSIWSNRLSLLANFGLATEGQDVFRKAMAPEKGVMVNAWQYGYAMGAFETMRAALDTAKNLKVDLSGLDVETAELAAKVLKALKLTEQEVASLIDAAGDVLRKHRLFFVGLTPNVAVWTGDGRMPFIRIVFKLSVSSKIAHDLYMEMVELILERLLSAHKGVSVEFEGATANNERKAA